MSNPTALYISNADIRGQIDDLFTDMDRKRARRSDPATSHEAAALVREFDGEHYRRILEALTLLCFGTCYSLAEGSGLDHVAVARRLPELERAGRIRRCEQTAVAPNGRRVTVWRMA